MVYCNPPEKCDVCKTPINLEFYDAKMRGGPWANMCPGCYGRHGLGLGIGLGQHYRKNAAGQFEKVNPESQEDPERWDGLS